MKRKHHNTQTRKFDPTTLEIYRALYTSVAEEMGIALRRTAFSPNIKERRDYSCAVFDSTGRVIAQGDHMPVHLGSMPMAVAAALREMTIAPGDVIALNDPFAGGTHLPDVTLVAGVFKEVGSWQLAVGTKEVDRKRSAIVSRKKSVARQPSTANCQLPTANCQLPTANCSTLLIARITQTSAGRRRVRWGWRQIFMARDCGFLR